MSDDYGVTYAVYDERRCPVLTRKRGPVSGGTPGKEMTMARVPEGLARELMEWAADPYKVAFWDELNDWTCIFCYESVYNFKEKKRHGRNADEIPHTDDCLHTRSAEWLAAEKAARNWTPDGSAKVVNR